MWPYYPQLLERPVPRYTSYPAAPEGFTDDAAHTVIGLGASAISTFPDRILQSEKNSAFYRSKIMSREFATSRGVARSAEDRVCIAIIESFLCKGEPDITCLTDPASIAEQIEPFRIRGLLNMKRNRISLCDNALPYARSIAACYDSFRPQGTKRLSSAI
jgi:oxygen-independent coproporphyrinogen-3 oxidase